MQETRQNKIARLLQKELSVIFQQQTRAMHGVMVSVTRTKISPDLSICTAYLSVFPGEKADAAGDDQRDEGQVHHRACRIAGK